MSDENAPVADEALHDQAPLPGVSYEWTDLAYGLLTEPDATIKALLDRPAEDKKHAAFVACWIVVVSTLVSGLAQLENVQFSVILTGIVLVFLGLMNWLFVSYLLKSVSSLFGITRSFRVCLSMIGWTTMPLVFVAPICCFRHVMGPAFYIWLLIPGVWTLYLQCLAFRHACNVGRSAAFSIFFFGPPALMLASIFWSGMILLSLLPMLSKG